MPATSARFLNRELSWLEFNARVLALAEDPAGPLLERVKFLAIYAQNLDEFFQVRVSGLEEQVEAGVAVVTPDGMTPPGTARGHPGTAQRPAGPRRGGVLLRPRARVGEGTDPAHPMGSVGRGRPCVPGSQVLRADLPRADAVVGGPSAPVPLHLQPLAQRGRRRSRPDDRRAQVRARQGAAHPARGSWSFPTASGSCPSRSDRGAHGSALPGMDLLSHHFFRVTRDADVEVEEDEADDLLAAIETVLQRRQRGALRSGSRSTTR